MKKVQGKVKRKSKNGKNVKNGPLVHAYVRISTDKQSVKNQEYNIFRFMKEKGIQVENWVQETASGTKGVDDRKLGTLLNSLKKNDVIVVSELSRLGRNLMEIMSILHTCMKKEVKVYTVKERYELGNNINSKVLAMAFSLSADIERDLLSQRTKEALARIRSEGKKLGRPKGSLAKQTKLTGKEEMIKHMLKKRIPIATIGKIMEVHRLTVANFVKTRKLREAVG